MIELPGVIESGMSGRNGQRKPGTTRGSPRAVRNDRGDRGDVGIIRSPVRASILPDCGGVPSNGHPYRNRLAISSSKFGLQDRLTVDDIVLGGHNQVSIILICELHELPKLNETRLANFKSIEMNAFDLPAEGILQKQCRGLFLFR